MSPAVPVCAANNKEEKGRRWAPQDSRFTLTFRSYLSKVHFLEHAHAVMADNMPQ